MDVTTRIKISEASQKHALASKNHCLSLSLSLSLSFEPKKPLNERGCRAPPASIPAGFIRCFSRRRHKETRRRGSAGSLISPTPRKTKKRCRVSWRDDLKQPRTG